MLDKLVQQLNVFLYMVKVSPFRMLRTLCYKYSLIHEYSNQISIYSEMYV